METRIKVLRLDIAFFLLVWTLPMGWSQSVIPLDTIQAQGVVLPIGKPVLHPGLISVHTLTGTVLVDSVDYIWEDSVHIRLRDDVHTDQYLIVRRKSLSPVLLRTQTWIDSQLVKSDYLIKSLPTGLESEASFPAWSNISYSGHFGRGINIGNNQNATLNSNFDLQLRGTLPHGIQIVGSLSDNSIPIQPEGNSLRLQEFDKVFIQLSKENATLIAGDHEIRNPQNYFMQYYKKTKGVYGAYESVVGSGWKQRSSLNYSVSKGKFKRADITAEEGNQGPYRISESQNHLFVVVLAGTERIYLDGRLLSRGELNDYTIDYNLGEVTFTPRAYISATSRIIVEYEFAEQNYLRSLFTGHTTWEKDHWELGLHIYSEQDGKNSYQNNLLTPENEAILAEAGNDVENLTGSSIIPWEGGFEEGVVLYEISDSMGFDQVLKLVKEPTDRPLYTAGFALVGQGNGDYEPEGSFTNGEVFRWVAPDPDGSHNGSYAPVTRLQAPQAHQMFGFRAARSWGQDRNNTVYSEWSLTHKDLNRFSTSGDRDAGGWAQNSGFSWGNVIDSSRQQSYRFSGNMEWRKASFESIGTYRPVEFERNWNYRAEDTESNEMLYSLQGQYLDRKLSTTYGFEGLKASSFYKGNRHEFDLIWKPRNVEVRVFESVTQASSASVTSLFSRPDMSIKWSAKEPRQLSWTTGYSGEYNSVRDQDIDSLSRQSVRFDRIYSKMEWLKDHFLTLSQRTDYFPDAGGFAKSFRTNDIQLGTGITSDQNYIRWAGTLRHIKVLREDEIIRPEQQGWNLLGQLLFSQRWFDGGWTNQGEVSMANGKEPRRQFQYIKVETGKGQYKFVDLNQDSIQQLNEFFPAIFPDERNYIRVSTLENTLISTFNYKIKWAWSIDVSKWTDHDFWSRWSTDNSIHLENKILRTGRIRIWNVPDSSLIASRQNVLANLYYNRSGKYVQEHLGYWIRNQKDFLSSGFESFNTRSIFSKTTINYTNSINSLLDLKNRVVLQTAPSFAERNFEISFWEIKHRLKWLVNSTLQLEYFTGHSSGTADESIAKARTWSHQISGQFKPDEKWSVQASVDYSAVRYDIVEQNLALEQVMLEGLQPGENFLWEANVQRRLPNNLILSLRYQGRKTGDVRVIHNGSVQANLLF